MSVRAVTVLGLLLAATALSGCHDGAGKRTETTTVRITGTPKAGYVPPSGRRPPADDFQTDVDLVRSLYALDAIPTDRAAIARYFAAEFVGPMTPTADGVTVDFDYRINGQDGAADHLTVTEASGDGAEGQVVSRFTNMGRPQAIRWTVCRQPDGRLRLMDVKTAASGPDAWDLRAVVGLPARPEGC